MRRTSALAAWAMCGLLTVACGGRTANEESEQQQNTAENTILNNDDDIRPQPTTVTGCLTAAGDRYVLTSLDQDAASPTTETYQLVATADNDLKQYVNREVRVSGEMDAARVADVREQSAPPVGTSGTPGDRQSPQADVKTQQATRFEVRQLAVSSVTPTGNECPSR